MAAPDNAVSDKRTYTTPRLTIHGTLKEVTLMRFPWPERGEWPRDPARVS